MDIYSANQQHRLTRSQSKKIFSMVAHRMNTKSFSFGSDETINLTICISSTLVELNPLPDNLTGFPTMLRWLTRDEYTQECIDVLPQRPMSVDYLFPRTHQVLQPATNL